MPKKSFFVQKSSGRPDLTYEPVQKLGEGAFGVAHLVRDGQSGQLRVLKTINKRLSQLPPAQMEREIRNLKACDHPHIIRFFEYYEDYENIYLVMERAAGGELHQLILEQRKRSLHLSERWVATAIRQCLEAISYVHSMGIIHKDLKSENILLLHVSDVNDANTQPHVVIIDLGIAELFVARLGRRARCTVVAGTPTHMAPEVWRGNFGPVADVWSLGVVLFELLSGELPFFCSSMNSPGEWIRLHRQGPNWALLAKASTQAHALCKRMLSADERMRPTAQQCLGHSWFKEDGGIEPGGDSITDDSIGTVSKQLPTTPMGCPLGGRIDAALKDYEGRSRFEKVVQLQVASQLHTSQIKKVSEIFRAVDRDRHGIISIADLVNSLRQLGVGESDAESYAACLDVDDNGNVEYFDLAGGCINLLYESLRGLLWQSFCILDVNGDGVLTRDGIRAVVTRTELVQHGFFASTGADSCGSEVEEALDRMDADPNGLISFDEVCRHILPVKPFLPSPRGGKPTGRFNAVSAPIQDEEFAQLLDEIDPDHAEPLLDKPKSKRNGQCQGPPIISAGDGANTEVARNQNISTKEVKAAIQPSYSNRGDVLTVDEEDLNKILADLNEL